MTRAGIYLRISKDPKGLRAGVRRQHDDCEDLARGRSWKIAEIFEDNDTSAYSGKRRPAYERMIEAVKLGEIDAIVAWHPDRLHRSPKELEPFIDLVEASNVLIATVQGGEYDLTTASGRMTARIVGAVARHESEHKSERLRAQREQMVRDGVHNGGGRRPYGYLGADVSTARRNGMVIDPAEAKIVREMARRVLDGESLRSIAADLNERGVPAARGGAWGVASVRAVLSGPHVAGKRLHRARVVGDGAWKPIIDEATWKRLRRRLGDPRVTKRGRPPKALLVGVLRCGVCGEPMRSARDSDGRRKYRCNKMPGTPACGGVSIAAEPTEAHIAEMVFQLTDSAKIAKRSKRTNDSDVDVEIAALDERLVEAADMFASGDLGRGQQARDQYKRMTAKIEEDRRGAYARIASSETTKTLRTYSHGVLRKNWDRMTLEQQRTVIGELLESVTVDRSTKQGPRFDGKRIRKPVPRRAA
jgi:DNA invertase Pin-like site-specific DNA recombinase